MKECLRCHHLNDEENNFCIKCGAPIKNICTNRNCHNCHYDIPLSDEAAFCPLCGSETLFKTYGLASSSLDVLEEGIPF